MWEITPRRLRYFRTGLGLTPHLGRRIRSIPHCCLTITYSPCSPFIAHSSSAISFHGKRLVPFLSIGIIHRL